MAALWLCWPFSPPASPPMSTRQTRPPRWLQGYPITGSGVARPAKPYQPIILKVTGKQVQPPPAHDGDCCAVTTGRALTSSGEYIPGIGICAAGSGSYAGGVTCVETNAQGNYSVHGCCDVRVVGYLADQGGPYVNGSVRHAPTGAPSTIVVVVGSDPAPVSAGPTPSPSSHASAAPTSPPATRALAQTGSASLLAVMPLAAAMLVLGGLIARRRPRGLT
jgi:hypothetical protein